MSIPTRDRSRRRRRAQALDRVQAAERILDHAPETATAPGPVLRREGAADGAASALLERGNRALKRTFDLVGASVGLLIFGPAILLFGLLVKLIDPGSAFFPHWREGRDGIRFRMWKIRTMREHHAILLARHLESNPAARDEWSRRYKLADDPRVVPGLGRLLRRLSLDELPQLWNVLVGDMSLVGPRPLPDYQIEQFDPEFRRLRCLVRPGLTGLWQVVARAWGDIEQHQALDTEYIRNWSLGMDLRTLARTLPAVIRGEGAH